MVMAAKAGQKQEIFLLSYGFPVHNRSAGEVSSSLYNKLKKPLGGAGFYIDIAQKKLIV